MTNKGFTNHTVSLSRREELPHPLSACCDGQTFVRCIPRLRLCAGGFFVSQNHTLDVWFGKN